MKDIKFETEVKATLNNYPVENLLSDASDLAFHLLEELSIYKQRNNIEEDFACEAEAHALLNKMGY